MLGFLIESACVPDSLAKLGDWGKGDWDWRRDAEWGCACAGVPCADCCGGPSARPNPEIGASTGTGTATGMAGIVEEDGTGTIGVARGIVDGGAEKAGNPVATGDEGDGSEPSLLPDNDSNLSLDNAGSVVGEGELLPTPLVGTEVSERCCWCWEGWGCW